VEGDWLVALAQEAGRGRQGRKWETAAGNYFGSTVVHLHDADPPAASLALAAGLALVEAIDVAVPGQGLMLKWPNDVLLLGQKLAGILMERSADRIAVGMGVNLATGPEMLGRKSAALGGQVTPQVFAPLLAGSFSRLLGLWRSSDPSLMAQAWLARAHPIGTRMNVHASADEIVSGRFDGLEPDGALRLACDDGSITIIHAGDVQL